MTTWSLTVAPSQFVWNQLYNDESFRDANGGFWSQGRNGNRWLLTLTYRNVASTRRTSLNGLIIKSRGVQNRLRIRPDDILRYTRLGTGGGSPQLVGAHTAGDTSLSIDGGSGSTDWLRETDYISIGNELKQVEQDVDLTAGAGTINIWPELHQDYVDNTAIEIDQPHGDFVLIDHSGMSGVPFDAQALSPSVVLTLEEDTGA